MEGFFTELEDHANKEKIISNITSIPSNYVGSKRRMLRHIWDFIDQQEVKFDTVFDAFSGSAIVSLMFKWMGKSVVANDLLTSSAINAISLLENNTLPLTEDDLSFLCYNQPDNQRTFVLDNYCDKFFTEKECCFLDRYRRNVELLCGNKFFCGFDLLSKATLASIPNSNFSVYGKDLKAIRSTHDPNTPFWHEKWRDTTRKRRDEENNIMFSSSLLEMQQKYKSAFALMAGETHITQNCFLGGRYYSGQTIAKLEHRLKHQKNNGQELTDKPFQIKKFQNALLQGNSCAVFNSDIIDLLKADIVRSDLLYLDPPYGGNSSDYAVLYRFLEEFLYEDKLENLEHIQKGATRYAKAKNYQENFELLLSLCGGFPYWMLSYNDSSFADIDTITSTIKNAGKSTVVVHEIPYTYQYRKGKNIVDINSFKENYADLGHQYTQRGKEYLILAT